LLSTEEKCLAAKRALTLSFYLKDYFFKQNIIEFLEAVNYFLQFLTKKIHVGVRVSTFLSDSSSIDLHAFEKWHIIIQAC
jgi:hypothetical protein